MMLGLISLNFYPPIIKKNFNVNGIISKITDQLWTYAEQNYEGTKDQYDEYEEEQLVDKIVNEELKQEFAGFRNDSKLEKANDFEDQDEGEGAHDKIGSK